MDLEYNVTIDDFIAFNLYHFRNSPAIQRQIFITRLFLSFIVIPLSFALIYFLDRDKHLSLFAFIAPVIGGVGCFLIYPKLVEPNLRKQIQKMLSEGKNGGILGKQKLTLTPEAIINETPAGEHKAFWTSVDKIAETADHIFIYVSAMSASIIPRAIFIDDGQRAAFLQMVQDYHHAVTGRTLPITRP